MWIVKVVTIDDEQAGRAGGVRMPNSNNNHNGKEEEKALVKSRTMKIKVQKERRMWIASDHEEEEIALVSIRRMERRLLIQKQERSRILKDKEEGAVLAPHVDRLPLVSSAIINVDQDGKARPTYICSCI